MAVFAKILPIVTLIIAGFLTAESAPAENTALSIGESTKFCEAAVPEFCVSTTCPQFCNSIRSKNKRNSCNSECKVDKRCKIKAAGGNDDADNAALDAQSRDQLWACIAEKRDPAGTTTGRRMTPWKEIQTDSFKKFIS